MGLVSLGESERALDLLERESVDLEAVRERVSTFECHFRAVNQMIAETAIGSEAEVIAVVIVLGLNISLHEQIARVVVALDQAVDEWMVAAHGGRRVRAPGQHAAVETAAGYEPRQRPPECLWRQYRPAPGSNIY